MTRRALTPTNNQPIMRYIIVVVTLALPLPVEAYAQTNVQPGPAGVNLTIVTIPEGDYWFEVSMCLDVPMVGPRCGWTAKLVTTAPVNDLEVFPSTIRLSVPDDKLEADAILVGYAGYGQGKGQDANTQGSGSGKRSNMVTGYADIFLLESDVPKTCINLLAMKDDLKSLELMASIHCVCLMVKP